MLIEALDKEAIDINVQDFYYLSRAALVKDERHLDKFDRVFGHVFKGLDQTGDAVNAEIPAEWLQALTRKIPDRRRKSADRSARRLGQIDGDAEKRLEEQKKRHEGGNKWIGTGGTSPFGNGGYNPEGVRIGGEGKGQGSAVKVWDKREYKNLDDSVELGVRNIKVALRRLRKFARKARPTNSISTAPSRRAPAKAISTSSSAPSGATPSKCCCSSTSAARWIHTSSSARSCSPPRAPNSSTWISSTSTTASMRACGRTIAAATTKSRSTWDVLHKYPHDYRILFVGDATMSPYEITYPGGSVEHWNEEAGAIWLQRVTQIYERCVWLNPTPRQHWDHTPSIQVIREIIGENRMFPLTIAGLDGAMKELSR